MNIKIYLGTGRQKRQQLKCWDKLDIISACSAYSARTDGMMEDIIHQNLGHVLGMEIFFCLLETVYILGNVQTQAIMPCMQNAKVTIHVLHIVLNMVDGNILLVCPKLNF